MLQRPNVIEKHKSQFPVFEVVRSRTLKFHFTFYVFFPRKIA